MNCEQAKERMVDRWIEGLAEDRRMELDQHVAGCQDCREENQSLQALWNGLGDLPLEEPGRALRSNFYQMMEAYKLGQSSASPRPAPRKSVWESLKGLWPRTPVLQFATAGMALVFGLIAGHLYTVTNQDQQQITQMKGEMRHMRQLVALSLLQQQSASDRLQGVSYGVRMEPADEQVLSAMVRALQHDDNVNVRLAALDALRPFSGRSAVRQGLRQALLQQNSPLVQIALIDWAAESNDRVAAASLLKLNQQPELHPTVKLRLASALGGLQ